MLLGSQALPKSRAFWKAMERRKLRGCDSGEGPRAWRQIVNPADGGSRQRLPLLPVRICRRRASSFGLYWLRLGRRRRCWAFDPSGGPDGHCLRPPPVRGLSPSAVVCRACASTSYFRFYTHTVGTHPFPYRFGVRGRQRVDMRAITISHVHRSVGGSGAHRRFLRIVLSRVNFFPGGRAGGRRRRRRFAVDIRLRGAAAHLAFMTICKSVWHCVIPLGSLPIKCVPRVCGWQESLVM